MTFTALAKIKYFCNTKVAELGEIFIKRKFSRILYILARRCFSVFFVPMVMTMHEFSGLITL